MPDLKTDTHPLLVKKTRGLQYGAQLGVLVTPSHPRNTWQRLGDIFGCHTVRGGNGDYY